MYTMFLFLLDVVGHILLACIYTTILLYGSVITHELGHLLACWCLGIKVDALAIGKTADGPANFTYKGFKSFFGTDAMRGQIALDVYQLIPLPRRKQLAVIMLGPIGGILGALGIGLLLPGPVTATIVLTWYIVFLQGMQLLTTTHGSDGHLFSLALNECLSSTLAEEKEIYDKVVTSTE